MDQTGHAAVSVFGIDIHRSVSFVKNRYASGIWISFWEGIADDLSSFLSVFDRAQSFELHRDISENRTLDGTCYDFLSGVLRGKLAEEFILDAAAYHVDAGNVLTGEVLQLSYDFAAVLLVSRAVNAMAISQASLAKALTTPRSNR